MCDKELYLTSGSHRVGRLGLRVSSSKKIHDFGVPFMRESNSTPDFGVGVVAQAAGGGCALAQAGVG